MLTGPIGAEGAFSYSTDDASGTARADTLTFQAATADGTISVGGVSIEVTAGQTATEVAEAVRAGLAADAFITGVTGRSITTGGTDGTLTLQWAASDGADPSLTSADTDTTGATVAVTATPTAFVAGANLDGTVDLDNANLTTAADAIVVIDGLSVTRSSQCGDDDAIPGRLH